MLFWPKPLIEAILTLFGTQNDTEILSPFHEPLPIQLFTCQVEMGKFVR
jgi:hypothetical protein